jgi:hypothetical protein
MWFPLKCYEQDSLKQRVQFCTGGCEDMTWMHEAQENPLLEAVESQRLVKTLQAGGDLTRSDL